MTTTTGTPQVWLGCLAAYNEGSLHGKWIDATDEDELWEAVKEVIKTSPAFLPEEWYIGDYDGFGSFGRQLGENPRMAVVAKVGAAIEEHGEPFLTWLETKGRDDVDLDGDVGEEFQNAYRGEWDDEEDFAMNFVIDQGVGWSGADPEACDALRAYLDWGSIAEELFRHGEYTFSDGYVFEDEC